MIETTSFAAVRPILAPLDHYLPVAAVLAGDTPGRIFVDDPAAPQTAVCWARHRIYVAGDADTPAQTAVASLFQSLIMPALRDDGQWGYILHTDHAWLAAAAAALPFTPPIARARRVYELNARQYSWDVVVPDGLRLRPVDAALLADDALTNLDDVTDEMVSERPSIDAFLAQSSGVCLQYENEIIGWCMSEYNSGSRCEIGIAIAEAWRRRGLATLLARALIGSVAAQGVTDIGWLCWADNLPSVKLAESLGFTLVDERPNFMAFLAEWLHFAVHGNLALENGRSVEAATFYQKALLLNENPPDWLRRNADTATTGEYKWTN